MLGQPKSDQVIDLQRLVNILLQLDFESINQQEPISKILQRVFPQLSPAELNKVEKKAEKLLQAMNEEKTNNQLFFKLTVTLAATVAGVYIGGPYVAKGSKAIATQIYSLLFGTPDPNSFVYGIIFKPCLNAINQLAMTYGPSIAGLTTGTVTFSSISFAESVSARIRSLKQWAFDKNLLCEPVPISLKNADEILAEFELMTVKVDPLPIVVPMDPLPIVVQYDTQYAILPAYFTGAPKETASHSNVGDKSNPLLKPT